MLKLEMTVTFRASDKNQPDIFYSSDHQIQLETNLLLQANQPGRGFSSQVGQLHSKYICKDIIIVDLDVACLVCN